GDLLLRISGNEVASKIEADVKIIKDLYEEIDKNYKKIDKVTELTNKMTVTAPSDGMISYIMHREGDTFEVSNSMDQWSLQLLDMYNTSEMYIYTTVSDLDVLYIRQDAPVVVTVDALPGETFDGVVMSLNQWTDRDGKTVYNVQI